MLERSVYLLLLATTLSGEMENVDILKDKFSDEMGEIIFTDESRLLVLIFNNTEILVRLDTAVQLVIASREQYAIHENESRHLLASLEKTKKFYSDFVSHLDEGAQFINKLSLSEEKIKELYAQLPINEWLVENERGLKMILGRKIDDELLPPLDEAVDKMSWFLANYDAPSTKWSMLHSAVHVLCSRVNDIASELERVRVRRSRGWGMLPTSFLSIEHFQEALDYFSNSEDNAASLSTYYSTSQTLELSLHKRTPGTISFIIHFYLSNSSIVACTMVNNSFLGDRIVGSIFFVIIFVLIIILFWRQNGDYQRRNVIKREEGDPNISYPSLTSTTYSPRAVFYGNINEEHS